MVAHRWSEFNSIQFMPFIECLKWNGTIGIAGVPRECPPAAAAASITGGFDGDHGHSYRLPVWRGPCGGG